MRCSDDPGRKGPGRPRGGPNSINANNQALASDVLLLEDRLRSRGCKLPHRNELVAHIIASSVNKAISHGRTIQRTVRRVKKEDGGAQVVEIKVPYGMQRVTAKYLMEVGLEGLPDDWFWTTYIAVQKILGPRQKISKKSV